MTRIVRVPFLLAWPPGRYDAQVLLPNTVFVKRDATLTAGLLAHELVHVQQIRRLGLTQYWWMYLRELLRVGYAQHPLEIEARMPNEATYQEARVLLQDYK